MSKFMINLTAVNPYDWQRSTPPIEVMVDNIAQCFVATISRIIPCTWYQSPEELVDALKDEIKR